MTSSETYTTAVHQGVAAVTRSADLWQQNTQAFTGRTSRLWQLPQPDFAEATRKFFDYLQDGLEVNKDVAVKWVGALTSISDAVGAQWQTVADFQRGHSTAISTWIAGETEILQNAAAEQAEEVDNAQREQLEQARQAERDRARAQRERDRRARQETRKRYEGRTKAELSEELAGRDLPKTGTVDELIDRLVTADTN